HELDAGCFILPGAHFELPPGATFEPDPQQGYGAELTDKTEKTHGS
ncbi:MAG: hypothetical protein ACI9I0_002422, partial [Rhodoferax sp.]